MTITQEQVNRLYANAYELFRSRPEIVIDQSGNGNHGTMHVDVQWSDQPRKDEGCQLH